MTAHIILFIRDLFNDAASNSDYSVAEWVLNNEI
jgi:hypothetical protein